MPRVKQDIPTREGKQLGLVCRHCGCAHHRVLYLKRLPGGVLLRRRECRHCGKAVITTEKLNGK